MIVTKKNRVILGLLTLLSVGQSLHAMGIPSIVLHGSAFLRAVRNSQQLVAHTQPVPELTQEVQAQQEPFVEVPQEDFEAVFGDISFLPVSDQQNIATNQVGARKYFNSFLKNFSWGLSKTVASACVSAALGGFIFSRWHRLDAATKLLGIMGSCGAAWEAYQHSSRLLADVYDARTTFLRIVFGADRNDLLVAQRDQAIEVLSEQLVQSHAETERAQTEGLENFRCRTEFELRNAQLRVDLDRQNFQIVSLRRQLDEASTEIDEDRGSSARCTQDPMVGFQYIMD